MFRFHKACPILVVPWLPLAQHHIGITLEFFWFSCLFGIILITLAACCLSVLFVRNERSTRTDTTDATWLWRWTQSDLLCVAKRVHMSALSCPLSTVSLWCTLVAVLVCVLFVYISILQSQQGSIAPISWVTWGNQSTSLCVLYSQESQNVSSWHHEKLHATL